MRLIDADVAIKKLQEYVIEMESDIYYGSNLGIPKDCICEAIEEVPTIEAEPVRHGKWIDRTAWCNGIGRCEYECSSCGYRVMHKPNSRGDGKGGKFCDNCGAKMDGGNA